MTPRSASTNSHSLPRQISAVLLGGASLTLPLAACSHSAPDDSAPLPDNQTTWFDPASTDDLPDLPPSEQAQVPVTDALKSFGTKLRDSMNSFTEFPSGGSGSSTSGKGKPKQPRSSMPTLTATQAQTSSLLLDLDDTQLATALNNLGIELNDQSELEVLDQLADILNQKGFDVESPDAAETFWKLSGLDQLATRFEDSALSALGGAPSASAQALLNNPNLKLTKAARDDLASGVVDSRLTNVLSVLAETYQLDVLSFKTGHPRCKVLPNKVNTGPNCDVSNHFEGRGVDIMAISLAGTPLKPVSKTNLDAKAIVEALAAMPMNDQRPSEVGSPWEEFEDVPGHFSNKLHQDHLHIGFN